ncbi:MAG: acetyltransferase [Anaerolineae bacterium]|mgnify:FL=1|jgi:sugar O-acyltransferase (sialic acid O-acetyltransferase NeuD family)|nr:acetyltransferase [Anaerolineae bacterium]MBT4310375.1 acetyltransferase [Anaerolineae bacterium]MBT4458891.1 acetyltransferase [Anaerolineae bacterium]MBT4842369.1 acetyltransferase [Anaerolineae bacterium]MBT6062161.1 acetyltransferase [Anaerolineae bacterium]
MENIIVIGAGGHAKVSVDILQLEGKNNLVGVLAEDDKVQEVLGYPLLGSEKDLPALVKKHALKGIVIAVGDNFTRATVTARIKENFSKLKILSALHPKAIIARDVKIGEGTVVMAGVSVNTGSALGRGCILNTNVSLDHDTSMGDFSSLAPGVIVGGDCTIGTHAAIGIGATILHGIQIGEHSVVGAASLVNKAIPPFTVAYGIPTKEIRKRKKGERYL